MREKQSSLRAIIVVVSLVLPVTAFTACGARADKAHVDKGKTPILLFTGTGTSPDDVKAIETLLASNHLDFSTVSSSELNRMGEKDLNVGSIRDLGQVSLFQCRSGNLMWEGSGHEQILQPVRFHT